MNRATSTSLMALAVLSACLTTAHAEEPLLGRYSGTMPIPSFRGGLSVAADLHIVSLDGGRVQATMQRHMKDYCNVRYGMAGSFEDNVLTLKANEGEGVRGCAIDLTMTRDGKTLSGTTPEGAPFKLSK
jgi:hypothetical protein